MKKIISLLLIFSTLFTFASCSKADKKFGVTSDENKTSKVSSDTETKLPDIMSLDQKMAHYFDISLFDEENYSDVYLGKKFKYDVTYDGIELSVPQKMENLINDGWQLVEGSDYDQNSLIFAKETVSLNFVNQNGAKLWALFYNSSNSSMKLLKCQIVKFRIDNDAFANNTNYHSFNLNNITNSTSVLDVIQILGTPSHFYQVTEDIYYFDYFITKSDRRNKIRIFVNLTDDCITAIEFSYYK